MSSNCTGYRLGRRGVDQLYTREYSTKLSADQNHSGTPSFLVLRYSGILSAFAALFYTAIQSDHCQTAVAVSQLGAVLVVTSSGIIFGYRVSAMWEGHKAVNLLVGFMYLFMITAWVRPFVLDTYNHCSDAVRNSGGRCIAISRYERSFFASRLQLSATSHRAVGASILCLILRI